MTSECCLLSVADEEWYSLKRVSSQWQSNIEIELYIYYIIVYYMQSILVLLSRITLLFYTLPLVPFVGLHGTAFVALFMGLYGSNSVCLPRTRQYFTSTVLAVTS